MPIRELGHIGLFVADLPRMRDFYARVIGLTVTDEDEDTGIVFLSSRPDEEHHELVLCEGAARRSPQQVSFRCDDLATVLEYWRRLVAEGVSIEKTTTHGNAVGVYFYDPEANRCEVYARTGLEAKQPFNVLLDFAAGEEAVRAGVHDAVAAYGRTGTPEELAGNHRASNAAPPPPAPDPSSRVVQNR
ncbi:VOC family protein [Pimelobacter simplex]|uniref:VOC family protein n=1 Tax=Nocardioides simplex TaxID=2045 RepID=UPI003AB1083E